MRHTILKLASLAVCLLLAGLSGCAPEEEAVGVVRPRATATPSTQATPQKSQQQVNGGIKDRGASSAAPTNPPDPEPSPLPEWTPAPAASLTPIIVVSGDPATDPSPAPSTDPTPDPAVPGTP